MKTFILAAAAILTLGAGAAFAQGSAGARAPVYGAEWAANRSAEAVASATHAAPAQTIDKANIRSVSTRSVKAD